MHVIINVSTKKGENKFCWEGKERINVFQSNYLFRGDIMLVLGGE